jgi:hypothetical protein
MALLYSVSSSMKAKICIKGFTFPPHLPIKIESSNYVICAEREIGAHQPRRVMIMSVSSIGNTTIDTTAAYTQQNVSTKTAKETSSATTSSDVAAVYEKSSEGVITKSTTSTSKSNAAVIAQLKADSEARTSQLQSLVQSMISKQGKTLGTADSMWSFLASGNFTADAETIAQAKKDVASDGYWGADQTSDRILSFAKALAGDDADKADELLEAFKKGYSQATKTWGSNLPSLCSDTYDMVEKKFSDWKNGVSDES